MTISNINTLKHFISQNQLALTLALTAGEEGEFFTQKLKEIEHTIDTMPKTYETDGQGYNATAYLRYFHSCGFYCYITERDIEEDQYQAFGYVNLGSGELGYVSIEELIQNDFELDYHFTPTPLNEIEECQ